MSREEFDEYESDADEGYDSMGQHYRCTECEWCDTDPDAKVEHNTSEFWGVRRTDREVILTCPDCGGDVEECRAPREPEEPIDEEADA